MTTTAPIVYGIVLILGIIAAGLFLRIVVLQTRIRRLRRAIAKLEGKQDPNPDDAEEDELGIGH